MNTQQKIDTLTETAITGYKNDSTHDEICGAVLPIALANGIGFGEISALVKNIGETNGFIVPMSERKKHAETNITTHCTNPDNCTPDFTTIETYVSEIATEHDVTIAFCRKIAKRMYKTHKLTYPEKPTLLDWQRAMVDCFMKNPNMTKRDVHTCVIAYKSETSVPKSMLAMLQYMHQCQTVNV